MLLRFASVLLSRLLLVVISEWIRSQFKDTRQDSLRWRQYAPTPGLISIVFLGREVIGLVPKAPNL